MKVPFLFFSDYGDDFSGAVTAGRRREFGKFARFADPAVQATIPDPTQEETFTRYKLDWPVAEELAQAWLECFRRLIRRHREVVVPHLAWLSGHAGKFDLLGPRALHLTWRLAQADRLHLYANLNSTDR